ncbi:UNVERIFIED_CONTAM: hypothetical protein PYX00_002025 [Menopon gallinae]|uniref:Uncharacterized protein n=1 Tax=Menopon gallinae TaxID=328185 RepID=A0AAW2IFC6_9NEOP
MSGESDGIQDAVIQDYLNDTDSELSSLSHLDAPNESMYMIGGVLIAMILVGLIIILLAVTISKLRKREENSGVHRTNVVHPEGVLQATVVSDVLQQDLCKSSHAEDLFIAPISTRASFASVESDNTFAVHSADAAQLPMFLYSTGNSRNSLNSSNDQDVLVHPSGPAEDVENNNVNNKEDANKKNIKGKLRKLVKRKTPPTENYALPLDIREQLKQIYVY